MQIKKMLANEWQTVQQLRDLSIKFDLAKCTGAWQCYEVCPVGCWTPNYQTRIVEFYDPHLCIACGACVLQCPADAIQLTVS